MARADPWSAVALLAGALLAQAAFEVCGGEPHQGRSVSHAARAQDPGTAARPVDAWTPRELRALPGIGPVRATGIARARWEAGLEGGPDSWIEVRGIGPATVYAARRALGRFGTLGRLGTLDASESWGAQQALDAAAPRPPESGADPAGPAAASGASPR